MQNNTLLTRLATRIYLWVIRFLDEKKILSDLERSREFLDEIIENIPDMIFVKDAKTLRFVRINKAGEALLGYKSSELVGKNDYDFFPKEQADFFTKYDREVLDGKKVVDIREEKIQTKSGETRWLHTKKMALVDSKGTPLFLLGIAEDITKEKESYEKLHKTYELLRHESDSTKKFQKAVEASTDGIVISDADTNIIYVNKAWEDMTGYTAKDVLGKKTSILKSEQTHPDVIARIRNALRDGKEFHSDEIVNTRKDGTTYHVDLTLYPTRFDGKVQFFVGVQVDITQRKLADQMKSEFISLASHQLRTPLTEIRWALAALANISTLPAEQAAIIEVARKASIGMSETIRSMLTVTRIESGNIDVKQEAISMKDMITDALLRLNTLRERKAIQLHIDCPDSLIVRNDEFLMKEIIANLLSNACKYNRMNGTVSLKAWEENNNVYIRVSDNGHGIPTEDQRRISEKFFRATNAMKTNEPGTGLGLYLVYSLVGILGGKISLTSEETKGTTFTICLPSHPSV